MKYFRALLLMKQKPPVKKTGDSSQIFEIISRIVTFSIGLYLIWFRFLINTFLRNLLMI